MNETSIIFDPAILYNLYFRVNRDGVPQTIIFNGITNVNTKTWQLNVFQNQNDADIVAPILQLTSGSGLVLGIDRITIGPTQAQTSAIVTGMYYWQLYNVTDKQTWLNGRAYFHRGEFDNQQSAGSDTITITVSGIPEAPQDGQQYARQNAAWSVLSSGGVWSLNNGGILTGNNTISGAFNIGFTNTAVGVGTSSPGARLDVRGSGLTSASINFRVTNNNGVGDEVIESRDDGSLTLGFRKWLVVDPSQRFLYRGINVTGIFTIANDANTSTRFDLYGSSHATKPGRLEFLTTSFAHFINSPVLIGGTSLTTSSILDVQSTTQAVTLPRMTTTQRDAIPTPSAGMLIFNITTGVYNFHNGTAWGPI